MTNPLDPVIAWYFTAFDCMRITSRVLERQVPQIVLPKHRFHDRTTLESVAEVEAAKEHLGDLAVLSLVSTFERAARDHLAGLPRQAMVAATPLEEAVRIETLKDLEYWRLTDRVLTVFGSTIPPNLIGQIKQIVEYRNWVAHGRSQSNPPSTAVVPRFAYQVLSEFLKLAGIL